MEAVEEVEAAAAGGTRLGSSSSALVPWPSWPQPPLPHENPSRDEVSASVWRAPHEIAITRKLASRLRMMRAAPVFNTSSLLAWRFAVSTYLWSREEQPAGREEEEEAWEPCACADRLSETRPEAYSAGSKKSTIVGRSCVSNAPSPSLPSSPSPQLNTIPFSISATQKSSPHSSCCT